MFGFVDWCYSLPIWGLFSNRQPPSPEQEQPHHDDHHDAMDDTHALNVSDLILGPTDGRTDKVTDVKHGKPANHNHSPDPVATNNNIVDDHSKPQNSSVASTELILPILTRPGLAPPQLDTTCASSIKSEIPIIANQQEESTTTMKGRRGSSFSATKKLKKYGKKVGPFSLKQFTSFLKDAVEETSPAPNIEPEEQTKDASPQDQAEGTSFTLPQQTVDHTSNSSSEPPQDRSSIESKISERTATAQTVPG